jgi:hypothetical protein
MMKNWAMRSIPLAIALLCLAGFSSSGQPVPDNVGKPVVRHMFDGSVGEKSRRLVAMRQYSLPRDQRGLSLDVPQEGMLLVQLRAGELATIINGERRQRLEGEWWTVSPPSAMRLETGDNTVVIDTILIGE